MDAIVEVGLEAGGFSLAQQDELQRLAFQLHETRERVVRVDNHDAFCAYFGKQHPGTCNPVALSDARTDVSDETLGDGPSDARYFPSGAYRDGQAGKLDYEGFLSPVALKRYAEYMDKNRLQSDGQIRDSDNWQQGIPVASYMKSMWRHFIDAWTQHRKTEANGYDSDALETSLCAVIFNAFGYLHELRTRGGNND